MRVYALFHPNTVGVKGLVVDDRGRVLLVRHTYVGGWHLPGGGVKRDESLAAALARELDEEVGIEVREAPVVLGRYGDRVSGRRDTITVYVVRGWLQSVHANLEIAAARFFDVDDLPPATSAATRQRLEEWRGTADVIPDWSPRARRRRRRARADGS